MMTLEEALGVVIKESIYDVDLETEELIVDTFVHGSYILKNVLGSYLLLDKNLKEEYSLKKIKSQEIQKILEKMKNSKDSSKIKSVKIPLGILYFIG